MTHDFIINDDSIVNAYGYRVLTSGIDTSQYTRNPVVLYMHNRAWDSPDAVIGKCVDLKKQGSNLVASIEFDQDDAFAKKVADKVTRGYMRMSSIGADVVKTSSEASDVLPGQRYETVTACKLIEVSVVDIGANDNALKLQRGAEALNLKPLTIKKETMSLKNMLSFSLNKKSDTDEGELLAEVQQLKLAKEQAEAKVVALEATLNAQREAQATTLVDKAVKLGIVNEALKSAYIDVLRKDYDAQSAVLSKLIADKEEADKNDPAKTNAAFKEAYLEKRTDKSATLSFDYLQKHDPVELRRIKAEEPELYAKLSKEYASRKRHV